MIYLALAALCFAVAIICEVLRILSASARQAARERQALLDQICHLAGKPWTPAPSDQWTPPVPDPDAGRYVTAPEQYPEQDWDE